MLLDEIRASYKDAHGRRRAAVFSSNEFIKKEILGCCDEENRERLDSACSTEAPSCCDDFAERTDDEDESDHLVQSNGTTAQKYNEIFRLVDKDGDGVISTAEIRSALAVLGQSPTEHELEDFVRAVDLDGNGTIEYPEFEKFVSERSSFDDEHEEMRLVFSEFDTDGNGLLDDRELQHMFETLGEDWNAAQLDWLRESDRGVAGYMSFPEFVNIMRVEH